MDEVEGGATDEAPELFIDVEGDSGPDGQSGTGAAPAAPQAAPDPIAQANERAERAERLAAQLHQRVAPWLEERERAGQQRAAQPPVTLEHLRSGEATADELLRYMDWQSDQRLADLRQTAESAATSAAAEQQMRGLFNASTLGTGNDFDSVRTKYVGPAYQENPRLQGLIREAIPENPALGEYLYGLLLETFDRVKGDPVAMVKAFRNGFAARQQGAQETREAIAAAARSGADRVLPGGRAPAVAGARRGLKTAQDVWDLPDEVFNKQF